MCRKSQCHSEAAKRPWESVLLKVPVFLKVWLKAEHLEERIATPVCELARNDRFFDSLKTAVFAKNSGFSVDRNWKQAYNEKTIVWRDVP